MKIQASALTKCSVVKGGDAISLGLVDENGETVELKVSTADACAIAMTLPRLLKDSIKEKYRDDSLRYVFPLDEWQVEAAANGSQIIVTLMTGDGFEVSFTSKPDTCHSLGVALRGGLEERARRAVPAAN